ncbi:hypothetical protein [Chitinibacter sp. GC72]|uniref:hypothetical protein n=1 Tax=Chitinibacter sp. GC72 TaxID=1526917 RepID=UPI0012FBF8FE|nr:hypothetical protein [Chitinibacter sp. GC72]
MFLTKAPLLFYEASDLSVSALTACAGFDAGARKNDRVPRHPVAPGAEVWNGQERRQNADRRLGSRRQYRVQPLLDTRTESDRRREGRRESDGAVVQFVACKV